MLLLEHEEIKENQKLQVKFEISHGNNDIYTTHWHVHTEILLILDGTLTTTINATEYILQKDDILLINSNFLHSTKANGKVSYILLQIPPELINRSLSAFSMVYFKEYYPYNEISYSSLRTLLLHMYTLFSAGENGYELLFSSYLYQFLYDLYKNFQINISTKNVSKTQRDLSRIEASILYVRLNFGLVVSLEEAAKIAGLSKEYFCRLFKEYTGQTFLSYVHSLRLLHFYEDLLSSTASITFLLNKNGLHNYKLFLHSFKELYHMSPAQLRNKKARIGV